MVCRVEAVVLSEGASLSSCCDPEGIRGEVTLRAEQGNRQERRDHSTPSLPRGAILLSSGCPSVLPWGPKYRTLGGVNSRHLLPLRAGGRKTGIQVSAGWVPSAGCEEGSALASVPALGALLLPLVFLGLEMRHPDLCSAFPCCLPLCAVSRFPLFIRISVIVDEGPALLQQDVILANDIFNDPISK